MTRESNSTGSYDNMLNPPVHTPTIEQVLQQVIVYINNNNNNCRNQQQQQQPMDSFYHPFKSTPTQNLLTYSRMTGELFYTQPTFNTIFVIQMKRLMSLYRQHLKQWKVEWIDYFELTTTTTMKNNNKNLNDLNDLNDDEHDDDEEEGQSISPAAILHFWNDRLMQWIRTKHSQLIYRIELLPTTTSMMNNMTTTSRTTTDSHQQQQQSTIQLSNIVQTHVNHSGSALAIQTMHHVHLIQLNCPVRSTTLHTTIVNHGNLDEILTRSFIAVVIGGEQFPVDRYVTQDNVVLKVKWHPLSNCHLTILSSDGFLRLFDVSQNPMMPEQEFLLRSKQHQQQQESRSKEVVLSFEYGGKRLWEQFTIFYVTNLGNIYALVPVVPFNCYIDEKTIRDLISSGSSSASSSRVSQFCHSILDKSAQPNKFNKGFWLTKAHDHSAFVTNDERCLEPIGPIAVQYEDRDSLFKPNLLTDFCVLTSRTKQISTFVCVNVEGIVQPLVLLDEIFPLFVSDQSSQSSVTLVPFDTIDLSFRTKSSTRKPALFLANNSRHSVICSHLFGVHQIDLPMINEIDDENVASLSNCSVVSMLSSALIGVMSGDSNLGHRIVMLNSSNTLYITNSNVDYCIVRKDDDLTSMILEPLEEKIQQAFETVDPIESFVSADEFLSETAKLLVNKFNSFEFINLVKMDIMYELITTRLSHLRAILETRSDKVDRLKESTILMNEELKELLKSIKEVGEKQQTLQERTQTLLQKCNTYVQMATSDAFQQEKDQLKNLQSKLAQIYHVVPNLNISTERVPDADIIQILQRAEQTSRTIQEEYRTIEQIKDIIDEQSGKKKSYSFGLIE